MDVLEDIVACREDASALRAKVANVLARNSDLEARVATLERELEAERTREGELLFHIDTDPLATTLVENEEVASGIPERGGGILYESSSLGAMTNLEQPKKEEEPGGAPPRNMCFNCNGDHMIAECQKPRDGRAIAQNRREFMKNQPMSSARYHVDETQRFGHLQPGLPSAKLRAALGLRDDQLPSYIYRMRDLGYPPGWQRQAEIRPSGMTLYLSEKKALGDLEDEDGEVADSADKIVYDTNKIIEWPGFNVYPPEQFVDETKAYRCNRISEKQLKDEMLRAMQTKLQKGYIKGEMQDTSTNMPEVEKQSKLDLDEPDVDENEASPESSKNENVRPTMEVKSVSEGTPIMTTFSPFQDLPSQSKWAKDTTDHLLFENLPDSTGKWDQMLEVIKKGRQVREGLMQKDPQL